MQSLRKKSSPSKHKNDTKRFLGEGVTFKAKLIGILEVSEARGDRMCQEALSDLKMAIRAAGEHKQRIFINIAIDGLRLQDEKSGVRDSLYHHPVHKISFIAQDMTDSRAFGYIFGSPDTGHRFFGIKTEKAASQVVIAMRDLFQVVFALKKKEIELAKQHLDKRCLSNSPHCSDSSIASAKLQSGSQEPIKSSIVEEETKKDKVNSETKCGGTAVADLVDLELELNSLQQGLNQMEKITPSEAELSEESKDDLFVDDLPSRSSKGILPPPPHSGRDRLSRNYSETSASVFSPKTFVPIIGSNTTNSVDAVFSSNINRKQFSFSDDFYSSCEKPTCSGDWFTKASVENSIFEETSAVSEITKDVKHEITKQEILAHFDVFTELDPLGTGRSKPYIDKKHFFQELKNPPKKVLNDLVSQPQELNLFAPNFTQQINTTTTTTTQLTNKFTADPFGEDPFVMEDPFAETNFADRDSFETEFGDFKETNRNQKSNSLETSKFESRLKTDNNLSKSINSAVILEKQVSLISDSSTSPSMMHQFNKQNTFDAAQFTNFNRKKDVDKIFKFNENISNLEMSSQSECAPEPPPRPTSSLMQIKPPPLPPKKQANDLSVKPPPRPPHTAENSHYDYMDHYETASNSLEFIKNIEKSPPLPVPVRKSKFESDFNNTVIPERPKKHTSVQLSNEDYLTPIVCGTDNHQKSEVETDEKSQVPLLLPPPHKSFRKQNIAQVTVASYLESTPNLTTSMASDTYALDGLDITLSQLTLCGLNELAAKLNISTNQLSNMTLVQLTNYLSNFVKSKTNLTLNDDKDVTNRNNDSPTFKADFAANFNASNNSVNSSQNTYDRYAVFRELMNEEIKQTKIDTEPEELQEEKKSDIFPESLDDKNIDNTVTAVAVVCNESDNTTKDKYAALREIVETELKFGIESKDDNKNEEIVDDKRTIEEQVEETNNIINMENTFNNADEKLKYTLIEYNPSLDTKDVNVTSPIKSPKSPINKNKSPIPLAIMEIKQNTTRLTSGSLSDVVSGSSPEVDNTTASNSEVARKTNDATGETWGIFDQRNVPIELAKEKQAVQSEEGVSPWSSDSKEFGNGSSPSEWRRGEGSGSGGEQHWPKRRVRRDQEGWWDTSAEPEMQYYPGNRRSTDSFEEEYYECYERPRRRKQTGYTQHAGPAAGGHSSSSRDVSPWEEEQPRRREQRSGCIRHSRQHSFDKHWDRRHVDSWDEEDDYEYEEEQYITRFHRPERHGRDVERDIRYSSTGGSNKEHGSDRWEEDDWNEDSRRHRRRRDGDRVERWCCPDWEQTEHGKQPSSRYNSGHSEIWHDRKHDDRYYSRESQESPWEDDYLNDTEQDIPPPPPPHYLITKRNWKRPSSASEMDRKTGEIKLRHYFSSGGSDGERDRRYRSGRRSRSRDSHYSEPGNYRHKISDSGQSSSVMSRSSHKSKPYSKTQLLFEGEKNDSEGVTSKKTDNSKIDHGNKKNITSANRKRSKDTSKTEEIVTASTFPRKSLSRMNKLLFENDFVSPESSPGKVRAGAQFSFENELQTSETESPIVINKLLRDIKQNKMFEKEQQLESDLYKNIHRHNKPLKESTGFITNKLLFEDDFSPSHTPDFLPEDTTISSIKEEIDFNNEEDDSFNATPHFSTTNSRKKKLNNKHRLSNTKQPDINIKKSESVNIFTRENDPFDDDFFCENTVDTDLPSKQSPRATDLKWTDDFQHYNIEEEEK